MPTPAAIDNPVPPPPLPALDANGDGSVTFGDLAGWLRQAFFLPGDGVIWLVSTYTPSVAHFLGLGPEDYGGVGSGLTSGVVWLAVFLLVVIVYSKIRELDRRLTRGVAVLYDNVLRRVRISAAVLRQRFRRRDKPPPATLELKEDLQLTAEELRVLEAHAELGPGYALAVAECALQLGVPAHRAEALLEKLKGLGLLSGTLGGDGQNAYILSAAGRGYLVFRRLARPD